MCHILLDFWCRWQILAIKENTDRFFSYLKSSFVTFICLILCNSLKACILCVCTDVSGHFVTNNVLYRSEKSSSLFIKSSFVTFSYL